MTALDVFQYAGQQVRTAVIDGEPCVLLSDVIDALGLRSSPAQVAQRLPDGVRRMDTITDRLGRSQSAVFVTEPGLYRVVLRSDSPKAEPFIEWVTADVLPAIRRTGRYGSDVDMLAQLPASKMLMLAAEAAKRAEEAEALNRELAPKAERWDDIVSAQGDFSVGDAAKMLSRAGVKTGRDRLFETLDEKRWTFTQGGRRQARQTAIEAGYLTERAYQPRMHPTTGELRQVAPQIRVTGRGLDRLAADFGVGVSTLVEVAS